MERPILLKSLIQYIISYFENIYNKISYLFIFIKTQCAHLVKTVSTGCRVKTILFPLKMLRLYVKFYQADLGIQGY